MCAFIIFFFGEVITQLMNDEKCKCLNEKTKVFFLLLSHVSRKKCFLADISMANFDYVFIALAVISFTDV